MNAPLYRACFLLI